MFSLPSNVSHTFQEICWLCTIPTDFLRLNEHEAARWLGKDDIRTVSLSRYAKKAEQEEI